MGARAMTPVEIKEASLVFKEGVDYSRVRVRERAVWPTRVARAHSWIAQASPPTGTAITLGQAIFFPRTLSTDAARISAGELSDMGWLIHELAHVWQYQHLGLRYLWRALSVQLALGSSAYDYGGQDGLCAVMAAGQSLASFNPEQQADIARDFYLRLRRGADITPWMPFVIPLRLRDRGAASHARPEGL